MTSKTYALCAVAFILFCYGICWRMAATGHIPELPNPVLMSNPQAHRHVMLLDPAFHPIHEWHDVTVKIEGGYVQIFSNGAVEIMAPRNYTLQILPE